MWCTASAVPAVVSGASLDDLDSFFGSAKPSATPSYAGSYTASPANMASPAASLGIPDDRNDFDLFGNVGSSSAQHAQHSQATAGPSSQTQAGSVDPFDLFGEGSTVPASAAAAARAPPAGASADDSLFGDVGGYQGEIILAITAVQVVMLVWLTGCHFHEVNVCTPFKLAGGGDIITQCANVG